jgi:amino acid transporter
MSAQGSTFPIFLAYVITVAGLDWLAYRKFHKPWIRRERARTTLGVLLVTLPALPLIWLGIVDLCTWIIILAGFGTAGAVTVFLDINSETSNSESIRQEIREIVNDQSHQ